MNNENNGDIDPNEKKRLKFEDKHFTEELLRQRIVSDEKQDKMYRKKKKFKTEDASTTESVIDLATAKILLKFLNQGYLDNIGGIISTGKEANVYLAVPGEKITKLMGENQKDYIAMKIYRTSALDFKKMKQYVIGDPRFRRIGSKTHQIIKTWAEKEYKNYKRSWEAKIQIPQPFLVRRNILIMEFVGTDDIAAPLLKNAIVEDYEEVYNDVFSMMKIMYKEAKLVHADLSEYNILYVDGKSWIIDVGQSVLKHHPYAIKFLVRDLANIKRYFERNGVFVPEIKELLFEICDDREEEELLLYC